MGRTKTWENDVFFFFWLFPHVSHPSEAFLKNAYNVLDLLAIIPLGFRIGYGIATPTVEENLPVHALLCCFVPVVRQLKLIRKFQKLQLLLQLGGNFWMISME